MKALTVAHLKANFSDVITSVKKGEEIIIEYGKKHEKIAVIVPYKKYGQKKRKVGLLKGKASFTINDDFNISDEDLLTL